MGPKLEILNVKQWAISSYVAEYVHPECNDYDKIRSVLCISYLRWDFI